MNCRDSETLILTERDGALTNDQRASLSAHLGACPACRRFQQEINAAFDQLKADAASVRVPDAEKAWRELQSVIRSGHALKKRPLAPLVWFTAPLAAAAAIALAVLSFRAPDAVPPSSPSQVSAAREAPPSIAPRAAPLHDPSIIAGADFVETGDPDASTMVYVDRESGWLVVWAVDNGTKTRG